MYAYICIHTLTLQSLPAKQERLIVYNVLYDIPSNTRQCQQNCCLKTKGSGNSQLNSSSSLTSVTHQFHIPHVNLKEVYIDKNPTTISWVTPQLVETAADLFFFLPTIMTGCRHKQSKQCPKGADAKAISLSTLPATATQS